MRGPRVRAAVRAAAPSRPPLLAAALVLLAWCAVSPAAAAGAAAPATELPPWLPLAEVTPGLEGYGLTVFRGTAVDTFGVRVLGVQHGVRAAGSLILVELSGGDLELTAVPRGMSGSPVFLKGRFAGAVAFGWGGALRPIAGLTPAEDLMSLPDQPLVTGPGGEAPEGGLGGRPLSPTILAAAGGRPPPWPLAPGADRPAAGPDPAAVALALGLPDPGSDPWPTPRDLGAALLRTGAGAAAGRDAAVPLGLICRALADGAVGPAPDAGGEWPTTLVPGAAAAVSLVLGDANLGALGTTTWVDGERVLLMGHPLMQRGPVDLPLATAEILGVFPSRDVSFKLGTMGPVLGSVHHDLRAGLVGRLGAEPPLTPVAIRVERPEAPESYRFQVARDPNLTPGLVFWCLYNSLLVRGDDLSDQTIAFRIDGRWRGPEGRELDLPLAGAVAGPGTMMSLAAEWMAPLQLLLSNRHARLTLLAVEAEIDVRPRLDTATIAGLRAPAIAEPGRTVPVTVVLEPYRDRSVARRLDLELPRSLAPGDYRLAAASARDLFTLEAQRAAGRFQDASLAAVLALLRTPRSATELAVVLLGPPDGLTVEGREFPLLPGSVASTLRGGDGVEPVAASYAARAALETGLVLEGGAMQPLHVRPRTRTTAEREQP